MQRILNSPEMHKRNTSPPKWFRLEATNACCSWAQANLAPLLTQSTLLAAQPTSPGPAPPGFAACTTQRDSSCPARKAAEAAERAMRAHAAGAAHPAGNGSRPQRGRQAARSACAASLQAGQGRPGRSTTGRALRRACWNAWGALHKSVIQRCAWPALITRTQAWAGRCAAGQHSAPGQLMLHRQRLPAAQPGRRGDAPGCTAGAKDDTGRAAAGPATAGSFCLHACLAHDLPAWAPPLQQTRPAHDPARLSGPFAGRGHPWTSDAARRCAPT